jgi:sRNA-binding protein
MSSTPPQTAPASAESNAAACADQLKALFPALFVGPAKPLKLKIQADIQERAPGTFTKQALSAFFRRYTGSTSYLVALTRAPHRFDLDGQPAGEIAQEHRQAATEELERRRANQQARRALEDEQRRNRAQLLRDYERTTLTRANFCALKGVAEAELDGLLDIARKEAAEAPPRREPPNRPQRPQRPQGRPDPADRPRHGKPQRERSA